jgi:hypothetical protein
VFGPPRVPVGFDLLGRIIDAQGRPHNFLGMFTDITDLKRAEEALRAFWLEKGKAPIIKAKHTELFIEPKVFTAGGLNPEIGKLIVKEYLSKVGIEEIAKGKVVLDTDSNVRVQRPGRGCAQRYVPLRGEAQRREVVHVMGVHAEAQTRRLA